MVQTGGKYDFDDGGCYIGSWEDGKAHGYGVCTGPKGQGEYAGSWHYGFEVSGVYTWPSGNTYEGQWHSGKRHGLGRERRGKWTYRGEWSNGMKGRYGIRECASTGAKYEGTWGNGLQDGFGLETYADGGTYQGQWVGGMRHGLGVRCSVPYSMASIIGATGGRRGSVTDVHGHSTSAVAEGFGQRGGFVLTEVSTAAHDDSSFAAVGSNLLKKISLSRSSIVSGLRLRMHKKVSKLKSSASSMKSDASTISSVNSYTESIGSDMNVESRLGESNLVLDKVEDISGNVTESYMGEWKNDKRSGFGVSVRSDGLKYEGEWFGNKRHGYGSTTLPSGEREDGRWKANVLVQPVKRRLGVKGRSDKVERAVTDGQHAAELARRKSELTLTRTSHARLKASQAEEAGGLAQREAEYAKYKGRELHRSQEESSRGKGGKKSRKMSLPSFLNQRRSAVYGKDGGLSAHKEEDSEAPSSPEPPEGKPPRPFRSLGVPTLADVFMSVSSEDLRFRSTSAASGGNTAGSLREHPSHLRVPRREEGGGKLAPPEDRHDGGHTPDAARKFIKSGISRVQRSFRSKRKDKEDLDKHSSPTPPEEKRKNEVESEEPVDEPVVESTDGDIPDYYLTPLDSQTHKPLISAVESTPNTSESRPSSAAGAAGFRKYKRDYIYEHQRHAASFAPGGECVDADTGCVPQAEGRRSVPQRPVPVEQPPDTAEEPEDNNRSWLTGTELVAFVVLLNVGFTAVFAQMLS